MIMNFIPEDRARVTCKTIAAFGNYLLLLLYQLFAFTRFIPDFNNLQSYSFILTCSIISINFSHLNTLFVLYSVFVAPEKSGCSING